MTCASRVVTTNLPEELVARLDKACKKTDRTKSWIVRQALGDWLKDQEYRELLEERTTE